MRASHQEPGFGDAYSPGVDFYAAKVDGNLTLDGIFSDLRGKHRNTPGNFLLLRMGFSGADESLQRIPLSSSQESPNVTGPLQGIYMWSACRSVGDLKNVRYRPLFRQKRCKGQSRLNAAIGDVGYGAALRPGNLNQRPYISSLGYFILFETSWFREMRNYARHSLHMRLGPAFRSGQ